ncbi:LPXTG cell wall anchor domain-containing protein [Bacillus toyonensis]
MSFFVKSKFLPYVEDNTNIGVFFMLLLIIFLSGLLIYKRRKDK